MRWRLGWRAKLALVVLVPAAACGGGGGGGGGPDPTATPVATPIATVTPAGTPFVVALTIAATAPVQGIQLMAFYPTAKGGFTGSADQVSCGTPADGTFTQNDRDDGTLILSLASARPLTLPVQVRCTFEVTSGGPLVASDIDVMVTEVTRDGAVADPATAAVTVAVL